LSGVADLATLPALRDLLMRAVAQHPNADVAVDLDGVGVLDDAGLGVLLGMAGRLRERGHDLVVVATRPALLERFHVTGFDRAVVIVSSLAEVRVTP
jgi:anti-anti-sigma factor